MQGAVQGTAHCNEHTATPSACDIVVDGGIIVHIELTDGGYTAAAIGGVVVVDGGILRHIKFTSVVHASAIVIGAVICDLATVHIECTAYTVIHAACNGQLRHVARDGATVHIHSALLIIDATA